MNRKQLISLKQKTLHLWCCLLLLISILSACYTPLPDLNIDDQLGSKYSMGRIMQSRLISSTADLNQEKYKLIQTITEVCAEQEITSLNTPRELKQCMELIDMRCDDNGLCRYHGFQQPMPATKSNSRKNTSDRKPFYYEYNATININEGWKSLEISVID